MDDSVAASTIAWLMEGDPSIRWQTMRDLLDTETKAWEAERKRILSTGCGQRLLALQDPKGTWSGGLYGPKWVCTTYTLLLLRDMGMPESSEKAASGARLLFDLGLRDSALAGASKSRIGFDRIDMCVVGMWLSLGAYFGLDHPMLSAMVDYLLEAQMPDGGWNCRSRKHGATHGSFHTTFNVLDGVRQAIRRGIGPRQDLRRAEARALEFMLMHRMFRSDKTGNVINERFTQFTFPPRWHYDVLRGLDYIRTTSVIGDSRLGDAVGLLATSRRPDGRWAGGPKYAGKVFFEIEPPRQPSRWNTLRALRVLRARDESKAIKRLHH